MERKWVDGGFPSPCRHTIMHSASQPASFTDCTPLTNCQLMNLCRFFWCMLRFRLLSLALRHTHTLHSPGVCLLTLHVKYCRRPHTYTRNTANKFDNWHLNAPKVGISDGFFFFFCFSWLSLFERGSSPGGGGK